MQLIAINVNGQPSRFSIEPRNKIGEGATATIYKIFLDNRNWAAKIYKPGRRLVKEKLKAMLAAPPGNLSVMLDGKLFTQYTWVSYLATNHNDEIVGFIMPYIDSAETQALDTYFDPVLIKRLSHPSQSALSFRIKIARNLCDLVANLHAHGHHFIDIKPQNIHVYRTNHRVVLMDCDGYSIRNTHPHPSRFPADLVTTDYIAPEVIANNLPLTILNESQDRYGLAVILFQLLNRGTHPYQGIISNRIIKASTNDERAALGLYPHGLSPHASVKPRPQSLHDLFLPETRQLFDQAFTRSERPTARQWQEHFDQILNKPLLVRCPSYPNNVGHIHFKGQDCIGCKIDRTSNSPRNKLIKSTSSDVEIFFSLPTKVKSGLSTLIESIFQIQIIKILRSKTGSPMFWIVLFFIAVYFF